MQDFDIDFSFVADDDLRGLIEDYYGQAVASYQAQAYLGTLVACGGVLEGLLAWALLGRGEEAAQRHPEKPIQEWDLSWLIKVAVDMGLLGKTAKKGAWAVTDFRNFIHPYRLLRMEISARPDEALGLSALSAVKETARSLRGRLASAASEESQRANETPLERSITATSNLVQKGLNFGWLEEGRIAGCRGPHSDDDLSGLCSLGIHALVRLAHVEEADVAPEQVWHAGLEDCHESIKDFRAPTPKQIDRVLEFIEAALKGGKAAAVSCGAGYGRTGTILACYLVKQGLSADEAMATVQTKAGRGPETDVQVAAVQEFEANLKKKPP